MLDSMTIFLGAISIVLGIWAIRKMIVEYKEEEQEYENSLFNQLKRIRKRGSYYEFEKTQIGKNFNEISEKILKLEGNHLTNWDNMRLIDSLTYHENNALKKVGDALNLGIPITDQNIQNALGEVTRELKKHYKEFCELQTADIQQETYILKTLRQKELERLEVEERA